MSYTVYLTTPHYGTPRIDADAVVRERGLYLFTKGGKEVAAFGWEGVIGWVLNDD